MGCPKAITNPMRKKINGNRTSSRGKPVDSKGETKKKKVTAIKNNPNMKGIALRANINGSSLGFPCHRTFSPERSRSVKLVKLSPTLLYVKRLEYKILSAHSLAHTRQASHALEVVVRGKNG